MDQELAAYLDRMSREIVDGVRGEMTQQIEGLREEVRQGNRHTHVLVEGLRSDIQLLAEGVFGNDEKLTVLKSEMRKELEETQITIAPYYRDLNVRVTRLEEWANRHGQDILEVIREKFGKRPA